MRQMRQRWTASLTSSLTATTCLQTPARHALLPTIHLHMQQMNAAGLYDELPHLRPGPGPVSPGTASRVPAAIGSPLPWAG